MTNTDCSGTIKTRSLPVTNEKVVSILAGRNPWGGRILDLGAGEGYLSSLIVREMKAAGITDAGRHLQAGDMDPGDFKLPGIKVDYCDGNQKLPYGDGFFNAVCCVEVIEHLENPHHFTRELYRILAPGGVAIITTPNVLNINSRLSYLWCGFPLLFNPLPLRMRDFKDLGGHLTPLSFYYLAYSLTRAGFREIYLHHDRIKKSASFYSVLLYPLIKMGEMILFRSYKKDAPLVFAENKPFLRKLNSFGLLASRTVIVEAIK